MMDKWEYDGRTVPKGEFWATINEMGREGWELISHEVIPGIDRKKRPSWDIACITFIVKRRIVA